MMIQYLALFLFIVSIIAVVFVAKAKISQKESVREEYAVKCLAAIVSLVGLAIASITSKEGISDQAFSLFARILGYPLPEASPVPFSEKALVVLLVLVAIYLISISHQKWKGLVSADEVDRERMKRSNSLISQAVNEGTRIVRHEPKRIVYREEKRIDPVSMPAEPNLVWHDHARELFELWQQRSFFSAFGENDWDSQAKCWVGDDRVRKQKIFLFCINGRPHDEILNSFHEYVRLRAPGIASTLYCVYRDEISESAIFETCREVTILSEEFLYQNLVYFSDYKNEIIRRAEKEFFPGTATSICDIYTASAISLDAAGENVVSHDLGTYLQEWSKQPPGKHLAIMGEYGQGKSTGALMYVYDSVRSDWSKTDGRIPLLIELRGKTPENLSQLDLMALWGQQYKFQASALLKLIIAGRIILIFEGFDEMANVADTESRVAHFRSLWKFAFSKSKIIFTGRRNLFFEDKELNIVFKTESQGSSTSFCKVVHLMPFDQSRIENSLRWASIDVKNEILSASAFNVQIRDIVSRPSLLYIVASMWDELRELLGQGGITSAKVIDSFILHSYARQEMKESDLNFMSLTTTERRFFHEGIAIYMASKGATNQIVNADLRAVVTRLYEAYPRDIHVSSNVVLETNRRPLKLRMSDVDEPIDYILTDVRTHGILVNDVGRRDAFRFAHKSFYELLAAKVHAYQLLDLDPVFYRSIRQAMDGNIGNSDRETEILRFFAEFLMVHPIGESNSSNRSILLLDLLFGISLYSPILRSIARGTRIAVMRVAFNQSYRRRILLFALSMILLQLVWLMLSTSTFAAAFPSFIRIARPKDVFKFELIPVIVACSATLLSTYLTLQTTGLRRKMTLWAAVLLVSDESFRTNTGMRSIQRVLGAKAATRLIIEMSVYHHMQTYRHSDENS